MSSPIVGDPLAALFVPIPPGPAAQVQHRTGVVEAFDQTTLANTIMIDGQRYTDVPLINSTEIRLMTPGAVVALMCAKYPDGSSSWAVLGRVVRPNTAEASQVVNTLDDGSFVAGFADTLLQDIPEFDWHPLAGGPIVEVTVGLSGRILVTASARIKVLVDALLTNTGQCAIQMSGANVLAPSSLNPASIRLQALGASGSGADATVSAAGILDGLNPGLTRIELLYSSTEGVTNAAEYGNRALTVVQL